MMSGIFKPQNIPGGFAIASSHSPKTIQRKEYRLFVFDFMMFLVSRAIRYGVELRNKQGIMILKIYGPKWSGLIYDSVQAYT
jgi:hypothetical protein